MISICKKLNQLSALLAMFVYISYHKLQHAYANKYFVFLVAKRKKQNKKPQPRNAP